jgi:hypothetical protein
MANPALPINPANGAFMFDLYADSAIAERGAYEMAYYAAFGELPAPSTVIEYVEEFANGRRMWTHWERFTPCWWAVGADDHGDQHVWPLRETVAELNA